MQSQDRSTAVIKREHMAETVMEQKQTNSFILNHVKSICKCVNAKSPYAAHTTTNELSFRLFINVLWNNCKYKLHAFQECASYGCTTYLLEQFLSISGILVITRTNFVSFKLMLASLEQHTIY